LVNDSAPVEIDNPLESLLSRYPLAFNVEILFPELSKVYFTLLPRLSVYVVVLSFPYVIDKQLPSEPSLPYSVILVTLLPVKLNDTDLFF